MTSINEEQGGTDVRMTPEQIAANDAAFNAVLNEANVAVRFGERHVSLSLPDGSTYSMSLKRLFTALWLLGIKSERVERVQ